MDTKEGTPIQITTKSNIYGREREALKERDMSEQWQKPESHTKQMQELDGGDVRGPPECSADGAEQ